jgi:primary-amine oxidase
VIHDHIINFKLDFDICGTKNSFRVQELKDKEYSVDWDDSVQVATYLATSYVANEDEARLNWPINGESVFTIGGSRYECSPRSLLIA